jgi:hypothetical protein
VNCVNYLPQPWSSNDLIRIGNWSNQANCPARATHLRNVSNSGALLKLKLLKLIQLQVSQGPNEIVSAVNEITNQPIIIKFDNGTFSLKLDEVLLPIESNNFNYALDLLFKAYHIFSIDYPEPITRSSEREIKRRGVRIQVVALRVFSIIYLNNFFYFLFFFV